MRLKEVEKKQTSRLKALAHAPVDHTFPFLIDQVTDEMEISCLFISFTIDIRVEWRSYRHHRCRQRLRRRHRRNTTLPQSIGR